MRAGSKPTFLEFFAGGGMARAGLGADWACLFANDFDPVKAAAYRNNWGGDHFLEGDVANLKAADLPTADLAWASFPCQDLSLAGNGAGLKGARSGTFWAFARLIEGLRREGRAPKILGVENVVGLLTSHGSKDFAALGAECARLGYRFGALTIDAAHFLPQSRPRLFLIAIDASLTPPPALLGAAPDPVFSSPALLRAMQALSGAARKNALWWRLPAPPARNADLASVIEADARAWHTPAETKRFMAMISPANAAKFADARARAKAAGAPVYGAAYRRTRADPMGARAQRVEARFDGLAGCLRTPAGGSSRQMLFCVEPKRIRSRLITAREAARLMGLPDAYQLPARYNDAYHLLGDGLAVPAVAYLAEHLLRPLVETSALARAAE
jgi:DNA (cytosine-5)-methyltransferase 1